MEDITQLSDEELRQHHLQSLSDEELQSMAPRRSPLEMVGDYASRQLKLAPRNLGLTARAAVEGTAGLVLPYTDALTTARRGFGAKTGPTATEWLSARLSDIGLPKPETRTEKVAQFGAQMIPAAFTGGATVGPKASTALRDVGKNMMASALKPTYASWKSGEAAVAIDTMLEKGLNVSQGGANKLRAEIDALNDQIGNAIASSTGKVDKAAATKGLNDLIAKFKNQVNPQADLAAIRKAWTEFKNHPVWKGGNEMTVQEAQELKKGTYRQLRDKYGELSSADIEAQKTFARGLKEGIETAAPEVSGLNREESKLIKTLNVAERRAMMDLNKNPGGLAWLTHSPANWAAFMADKSSLFKSLVARMSYSGANVAGKGLGATAGVSLYGISKGTRSEQEP